MTWTLQAQIQIGTHGLRSRAIRVGGLECDSEVLVQVLRGRTRGVDARVEIRVRRAGINQEYEVPPAPNSEVGKPEPLCLRQLEFHTKAGTHTSWSNSLVEAVPDRWLDTEGSVVYPGTVTFWNGTENDVPSTAWGRLAAKTPPRKSCESMSL
jgi:hypothetical protein